jgi:hypothetical protein
MSGSDSEESAEPSEFLSQQYASLIEDLKNEIETQYQPLANEIEKINTKLRNLVSTLGKKGFPGEYKDGHGKEPVLYLKESEDGGYIWAKGEITAGQMGVNPAFHVT